MRVHRWHSHVGDTAHSPNTQLTRCLVVPQRIRPSIAGKISSARKFPVDVCNPPRIWCDCSDVIDSVEFPHHHVTCHLIVPPEVWIPVEVEVSNRRDAPIGRTGPGKNPVVQVKTPFISQYTTWPVLWLCQADWSAVSVEIAATAQPPFRSN